MKAFQIVLATLATILGCCSAQAQQIVKCHSGGTGTIPQCQQRDAQAQAQSQVKQVVQCHSGGTGTIPECQQRDAQAQAKQTVQCHSGGTGTIPECQQRDAQAQAKQTVQCHSGGTGTIPECQQRDAQAQAKQTVQCHSGGTGTIPECQQRDAQAQAKQVVNCHSGGTGTIPECQQRDAQAQARPANPSTQSQTSQCWISPNGQRTPATANSTPPFAGAVRGACGSTSPQFGSSPVSQPPMQAGRSTPNLASSAYQSTSNPFVANGLGGQCTAFAFGRALEVTGKKMDFTGNPKDWLANTSYPTGSTPRPGAIAVWGGTPTDPTGHVAFVESVQNGSVTITEANVNSFKNTNYGGGYDGSPRTFTESQITDRTAPGTGKVGKLLGYIYLQ